MELRLLAWLGAEPRAMSLGLTLALTYCVHAVVWAAAALIGNRMRAVSAAVRHLCWKIALFAPVLTALVAAGSSDGSQHVLARRELNLAAWVAPALTRAATTARASTERTSGVGSVTTRGAQRADTGDERSAGDGRRRLGRVLVGVGLGALVLGGLRFVASALVLRTRLRSRSRLSDTRLLCRFEALQARMGLRGVRLTESPELASPLVIGRSEVCVPSAILGELTDSEVDTVLAHELAHVERGDGLWFPLVGAVQSVLWLQPTNRWVSARIRETAELACDDRAVDVTGDALGLARALVRVAASASLGRDVSLAPTMARSTSTLMPRLRRLTGDRAARAGEASNRSERPWMIVAVAALAGVVGTLRVHVAEANARTHTAQVTAPARSAAAPNRMQAPNAAEYSERLAELARREHDVTRELEAAERAAGAARDGSPESVRVLELQQEQRHLREMQRWLEERFALELSDWEKSSGGRRRASL